MDVIVASVVFWGFLFSEGRRLRMKRPWIYVLFNLLVGVSFALPAFLYSREKVMPRSAPLIGCGDRKRTRSDEAGCDCERPRFASGCKMKMVRSRDRALRTGSHPMNCNLAGDSRPYRLSPLITVCQVQRHSPP